MPPYSSGKWQIHGYLYCYSGTEERQDAAAAGTGSTAVATSLPPDFSGAAAGKHAPADDLAEASRDSVPVER